MTKTSDKIKRNALDLLRQATAARLTRREAVKMGLVSGTAGILATQVADAADRVVRGTPINPPPSDGGDEETPTTPVASPPTGSWLEPLPVPQVLQPGAAYGTSRPHQYYDLCPPQKHYSINVFQNQHSFSPSLPTSPIWGLNGTFPGPTIDARYGEPWMLRTYNQLPPLDQHTGFGVPQTIFHLHNAHTATRSDGGPWDWDNPGGYTEYHHLMQRAGFSDPGAIPSQYRDQFAGGDVRETLTTLFMHYHRPEFTSPGLYKGLVNFVRFFDERDTGDETDPNPQAYRLPSGEHDIPLLITDKLFDPDSGELIFDQFNLDGFLGDKITVNGKIKPYLEVKRRKYRFRLLDGGPARFYLFVLRHKGTTRTFTQISHSGNLLEKPRTMTQLELQVAERSDIIIDFSQFKAGDKVYLCNRFAMKDGRRPERDSSKLLNPDQNQLLEFRVVGPAVNDPSRVPSYFRPFPSIDLNEVVKTRYWRFERTNGMWGIRDGSGETKLWDPEVDHTPEFELNPPHQIKRNTAERWILENIDDGWEHPVHIHLEESQLLKVNGVTPTERIRTDMYRVAGPGSIELFMRFRDYPDPNFGGGMRLGEYSRYVMHCHNTTHEDHAMMVTWNLVP